MPVGWGTNDAHFNPVQNRALSKYTTRCAELSMRPIVCSLWSTQYGHHELSQRGIQMIKTIRILFAAGALALTVSTIVVANAAPNVNSCGKSDMTSIHRSACSNFKRHHQWRRHHMHMHMMKKY